MWPNPDSYSFHHNLRSRNAHFFTLICIVFTIAVHAPSLDTQHTHTYEHIVARAHSHAHLNSRKGYPRCGSTTPNAHTYTYWTYAATTLARRNAHLLTEHVRRENEANERPITTVSEWQRAVFWALIHKTISNRVGNYKHRGEPVCSSFHETAPVPHKHPFRESPSGTHTTATITLVSKWSAFISKSLRLNKCTCACGSIYGAIFPLGVRRLLVLFILLLVVVVLFSCVHYICVPSICVCAVSFIPYAYPPLKARTTHA